MVHGPPMPPIDGHRFVQCRPKVGIADCLRFLGTGDCTDLASQIDELPVERQIFPDEPFAIEREGFFPRVVLALGQTCELVPLRHLDRTSLIAGLRLAAVSRPLEQEMMKVDPRVIVKREPFGLHDVAFVVRPGCRSVRATELRRDHNSAMSG